MRLPNWPWGGFKERQWPDGRVDSVGSCHMLLPSLFSVLCLVFHAANVAGDFGTLVGLLAGAAGVAGVSASHPKDATLPGFPKMPLPQFGSSPGAQHILLSASPSWPECEVCKTMVQYDGRLSPREFARWHVAADFVAGLAYLSIPLQLIYFINKSLVFPYRVFVLQFGALVLMFGLAHLLEVLTFGGLSPALLTLIVAAKLLAAMASCTIAISLVSIIPDISSTYSMESTLQAQTEQAERQLAAAIMADKARQRSLILAQNIRASLDRTLVVSSTLVALQDRLGLENACLWMPSPANGMELAYECERREKPMLGLIPFNDPTGQEVVENLKPVIIPFRSNLAKFSTLPAPQGSGEPGKGCVAAVAIPLLSNADLAGEKLAELATAETTMFGLLTLVIPTAAGRKWVPEDLQTVEEIANQLVVGLSHTAVVEEMNGAHAAMKQQEAALRRAELEGKSAVLARNIFLTVMKHEMRTPMHSITALSSLLAESDLEEKQAEAVATVATSSTLLSRLVSDILDFWRLEDDSLTLASSPFDLPHALKEAQTLIAPMAKDKGVRLNFQLEPNLPPTVVGDKMRLLQVILNVVSNAIKATSAGNEVAVGVSREKLESLRDGFVLKAEAGFSFLRFEARDAGPSLSPSDLPRLFQKFQEDDRGARTGLGLALSRKFVQLMDGHIWMESNGKDRGATCHFIVRFKLLGTNLANGAQAESDEDSPDVNFFAFNIMVVDDNLVNRLVTKRLLVRMGCTCEVVDSGKECLRLLAEDREQPFDVVLLDLMMPEMDGYTVANKVKEEVPESKRPVIVALTANSDKHTEDLCLQHGMEGMITKPISLNALRDVLGKMLETKGL